MPFRLLTNSMTLNDLEPTLSVFFAILASTCAAQHAEHNGDSDDVAH